MKALPVEANSNKNILHDHFNLDDDWVSYPVVAFDTETSGPYAIESEVIELGAVKWFNGQIIDRFQTLLKPRDLLVEDNIRIHGITNFMVNDAPQMKDQIAAFHRFVDGSVLLAHHAPFDLGFLAMAFENHGLAFPQNYNLCTSLLSRALLTTKNHKLQTLIQELNLDGGSAHRALDDAYACLQVFFKCVEKLGPHVSLRRLIEVQAKELAWIHYAVKSTSDERLQRLARASAENQELEIIYNSGQTRGKPRRIGPKGLVRNPDGDYVVAYCFIDHQRKRFYLEKIEILD